MKTAQLDPESITVLDFVDRSFDKVKDHHLQESIKANGIQQPSVVVEDEGSVFLIDGLRRRRNAIALGIKLPVVFADKPKDVELSDFIRRTRFIIDQHRQDLTPTQKSAFIKELKERFGMNHKQVAAYLGIAKDSVTNWVAVDQYIPEIREAVDRGQITMHAARVFDGLTDKGQKAIWKGHQEELQQEAGSAIHKRLRREYSPTKYPEFYRNAESTKKRMNRKADKRKSNPRPNISAAEKNRLWSSLDMKETELKEGQQELETLKRQINASIAPIAAIMRNEKLWAMVPDEMKPEIERFAEVYV